MKKISIISVINSIKELIQERVNQDNSDSKNPVPRFWQVDLDKNSIRCILTLYIDKEIDFERCSESWLKRLFCHLAHGNDACGCQEFVDISNFYKGIYRKINSVLGAIDKYVDHNPRVYVHGNELVVNRKEARLRISTGYVFPISVFSEDMQAVYTKYQNNEIEYDILEPYLLEEMDYWDEYKGHPRPVSNK